MACDGCGKWRRLPSTVDMSRLPEQVFYQHHHIAPSTISIITASTNTSSLSLIIHRHQHHQHHYHHLTLLFQTILPLSIRIVHSNRLLPCVFCLLPEQWYCSMNQRDPYRASCTSPEEVNTESSTSPTRNKGDLTPLCCAVANIFPPVSIDDIYPLLTSFFL